MPFKYQQNCNNWIETFHASERQYFDSLTNVFNSRYNSPAYSTYVVLREYMDESYLLSSGGHAISGQLKGYQELPPWWRGFAGGSAFKHRLKLRGTNSESVQNCRNHISRQFNWRIGHLDNISEVIEVGAPSRAVTRELNGNLRDWIMEEDVFSHVIPNSGVVSYTPGRCEILRRILR